MHMSWITTEKELSSEKIEELQDKAIDELLKIADVSGIMRRAMLRNGCITTYLKAVTGDCWVEIIAYPVAIFIGVQVATAIYNSLEC